MNNEKTNESIEKIVISCLDNVGVQIPKLFENQDIDLTDYDLDSLTFFSFIIEIEREFNITIPDDFLIFENYKSFRGVCNFIEDLIQNHKIE